jgi:hypothetical protein
MPFKNPKTESKGPVHQFRRQFSIWRSTNRTAFLKLSSSRSLRPNSSAADRIEGVVEAHESLHAAMATAYQFERQCNKWFCVASRSYCHERVMHSRNSQAVKRFASANGPFALFRLSLRWQCKDPCIHQNVSGSQYLLDHR